MDSFSSKHSRDIKRVLILVDGQNLVGTFQDWFKEKFCGGQEDEKKLNRLEEPNSPSDGFFFKRGLFVWATSNYPASGLGGGQFDYELVRSHYYTAIKTKVGEDIDISELKNKTADSIRDIPVLSSSFLKHTPKVFESSGGRGGVKGDDVTLSVEALRYALRASIDIFHIYSGDGDFVPLVEELKNIGVHVFVSSFPRFTNNDLKNAADHFFDMEGFYIEKLRARGITI